MGITCPGQGYEISDEVCKHRIKKGYFEQCLTCKRRARVEAEEVRDRIRMCADKIRKKKEKK